MSNESTIRNLRVSEEFRPILEALSNLSDKLYDECVSQIVDGYDSAAIENILGRIDSTISRHPLIEKARIEGSKDVNIIISQVNLEIQLRMKQFRDNIREEDRQTDLIRGQKSVEDIETDFKGNTSNTMQRKLQELDAESDVIKVGTLEERYEGAKTEQEALKTRIEMAKRLDESGVSKDEVLTSISDDSKKLKPQKSTSYKTKEEYAQMLEEIEIKARNVELRGENFTEEDYKKIATLMSELGKFPDTSAAATLKRKLESLVTVDADGKVIKVNNVKELKLTTKYARDPKFGTAIDFDKEISDAGDHLLTQRKTELETILTTSAFFKLYKDEADVIKAKLLKPDITMEELEDIRKEMNELIKTAVDRDIEDLLSQAEVDMTDIPALESAKRDAELKKIKLGTVAKTSEQRKEYKADIEKKKRTITIFGREIDLGEGRDLSDLEDEDKVDERLDTVDEIYDKLMEGDETEKETMMTALSTHVKKPNIFRRAWFKITHWNQPSLYEQMQEDWLLDQIDQGITDVHREVIVAEDSEPSWVLTQEQEENIRTTEKEIADEAKKKARKDVVTRGADPKTAARDAAIAAKDNIDQEDLDLNI